MPNDAIPVLPERPIELYSTNAILRELSKRFEGFLLLAWEPGKVGGVDRDTVYWDTDLVCREQLSDLANYGWATVLKELDFE